MSKPDQNNPRSKGDDVIDGMLYIVEDWWSIHSMDINTSKTGHRCQHQAVYAPIEDKAWMPVSHRLRLMENIWLEFDTTTWLL